MKNFYTPPHAVNVPDHIPLVFLAGPVQGAFDWQTPMAVRLLGHVPGAAVASPRRTPEDQRQFNADEQVAWEHAALERSRRFGVLSFWLAAQNLEDETYPAGRAYAQTTRIELGKATGWRDRQPELPVVVGFDPDYTLNGGGSEGYIRREAKLAGIAIYNSDTEFLGAIMQSISLYKSSGEPLFVK